MCDHVYVHSLPGGKAEWSSVRTGKKKKKRLKEHFQKRGPIYIRCCNWFVRVEQEDGGSGGNAMSETPRPAVPLPDELEGNC